MAQWISAESCLVGEGHRKGAVLKALPSCHTASWHLEIDDGCSALMEDSSRDFKDIHSITRWHVVSPLWVDVSTA